MFGTDNNPAYAALVALFHDWRAFETPPLANGAPDYRATSFAAAQVHFHALQARLQAIDIAALNSEQHIDWQLVRAEMNGYDFNTRVLQPWARDPAFYQTLWMEQSDVPAHEGPCNHATCEVWTYRFPLAASAAEKLSHELSVIPPLLAQARENLTGNARDLWLTGINNFEQQERDLLWLQNRIGAAMTPALRTALECALHANREFIHWLQLESAHKTGPSGIGKDNYNWYQEYVHLVPLSWDQQVELLQRELVRAWSSLAFEEQRNRHLPALTAADTPEEYARRADAGATKLMAFLRDKDVMSIKPNMEPALREHLLDFVPADKRHFFDICRHYDPVPQYCHWYHWFDLAQMRDEPHASPIRRGPLLYNIWDSRNEGIATGVEEWFMHLGLHDDSPRTREIVWVMLAQRAARALGSLYAHANEMTMDEAAQFHLKWTPRNWMSNEPELLRFEQHLYLRQPGYGTSYLVGKYLIENVMMKKARAIECRREFFEMREFFRAFNDAGGIPVHLMT